MKDTEKHDAVGKRERVFVLASIISTFCLGLSYKRIVRAWKFPQVEKKNLLQYGY